MKSVRRRLLVGTASATAVIFLAAAVSIYVLTRQHLVARFDAALLAKARAIAAMTDLHDHSTDLDADDAQRLAEFQGGHDPQYFQITADDGQRRVSPTLGDHRLDAPPGRLRLPDGRPGRSQSLRAAPASDEDHDPPPPGAPSLLTITVAKATTELDEVLSRLAILLAVISGAATAALLGITGWLVRSAMRPVDQVAREIAAIDAADLSERVGAAGVPIELAPIVLRLNDLLQRLQAAFEREKCFTADAAHELRTPLAGLQTALEVCAAQNRDTPQYERVVAECLKVVRQMDRMIDNLLLLARADADRVPVAAVPVNVSQVLRDSWQSHQPAADKRQLHVEWSVPDHAVVRTDPEKLQIIVNNLLANAVQYSDEGGQVSIAAAQCNGAVRLEITNSGSRVRPQDAQRVFDRFWRADPARASQGEHSGLGLAVCHKLAVAIGATIAAEPRPDHRFIVRVNLPSSAERR
jgi:two-component system OmpR family sensor kinase